MCGQRCCSFCRCVVKYETYDREVGVVKCVVNLAKSVVNHGTVDHELDA